MTCIDFLKLVKIVFDVSRFGIGEFDLCLCCDLSLFVFLLRSKAADDREVTADIFFFIVNEYRIACFCDVGEDLGRIPLLEGYLLVERKGCVFESEQVDTFFTENFRIRWRRRSICRGLDDENYFTLRRTNLFYVYQPPPFRGIP